MASYNSCTFVGNLARDPEGRQTNAGLVTKFTVAVNNKTKKGNDTTWVDCEAWDNANYKLATTCNTYLKQGALVLVAGRLKIESYVDKNGVTRKATKIVLSSMQMLGSAGKRDSAPEEDRPVVTPKGGVEAGSDWDELDNATPY